MSGIENQAQNRYKLKATTGRRYIGSQILLQRGNELVTSPTEPATPMEGLILVTGRSADLDHIRPLPLKGYRT